MPWLNIRTCHISESKLNLIKSCDLQQNIFRNYRTQKDHFGEFMKDFRLIFRINARSHGQHNGDARQVELI